MARIKRKGLDYFPLNTDFIQDRRVRRIMKRKGDEALSILLATLSYIYAGEGYYVRADEVFYEDLADNFYRTEVEQVKEIIEMGVELGLFDDKLYEEHHILTSLEIQQQYTFIKKPRNCCHIDAAYNLLPDTEEHEDATEEKDEKSTKNDEKSAINDENRAKSDEKVHFGTQRKEKESIEKQSTEKQSTSYPPIPPNGGVQRGDGAKRMITREEIARMAPPDDGRQRNLEGLILTLDSFNIPLSEQREIILKSDYGRIGHPMWRGFEEIRTGRGQIRMPGRYLLSLCK